MATLAPKDDVWHPEHTWRGRPSHSHLCSPSRHPPGRLSPSFSPPTTRSFSHLLLAEDHFAPLWGFARAVASARDCLLLVFAPSLLSALLREPFSPPHPRHIQVKCASYEFPEHSEFSPTPALTTLYCNIWLGYLPPPLDYKHHESHNPVFRVSCAMFNTQQDVCFRVDAQHMPRTVPDTQRAQCWSQMKERKKLRVGGREGEKERRGRETMFRLLDSCC